jgi:hypothetical protein
MEKVFNIISTQLLTEDSFSFMPVFWVLREKARKRGYEIK